MTDRELLEKAAKAAGYEGVIIFNGEPGVMSPCNPVGTSKFQRWNPLTDDGDALRLAVKLELLLHIETCYYVSAWSDCVNITEHIGNDGKGCIYAATRRAIVRAAAAIGKN